MIAVYHTEKNGPKECRNFSIFVLLLLFGT